MAEFLIDQGIEFEMHKALSNGRMCDFYFDGMYWEMDGLDRTPDFFEAKYDDLPYVVVTPEDFRFRIERHLATAHAENGDPVVSIEPLGEEMTYDVEMAPDGPLNFLANGIVSQTPTPRVTALISYRTAWLKANYPAEYMAALISSVMSTKDKVPFFVAQCEDMGIEVLPPDVNQSGHDFKVVEGNIRFGLDAVKGLGYQAVEAIIRAREEGGPFTSVWDFCRRVDCQAVNKKASESLVKCGAFDSLPGTRTGMMEVLPRAQAAGQQAQQDARSGQCSFFDLDDGGNEDAAAHHDPPIMPLPDDRKQLNEWEKETLGLFLSSHPLKEVRPALRAKVDCSLADLGEQEGRRVGHRRRDDRRVQADQDQEGRPDDVRHARRPRGPGRAARLQLGLRRERRQGRRRQDRDRARARGPQGGGGDQARRPGGGGLRADRRGGGRGGRERGRRADRAAR